MLRGHIDFSSDPWPSISPGAKDLVKKMLRQDAKERLTAAEILSMCTDISFYWLCIYWRNSILVCKTSFMVLVSSYFIILFHL